MWCFFNSVGVGSTNHRTVDAADSGAKVLGWLFELCAGDSEVRVRFPEAAYSSSNVLDFGAGAGVAGTFADAVGFDLQEFDACPSRLVHQGPEFLLGFRVLRVCPAFRHEEPRRVDARWRWWRVGRGGGR